MRGGYSTSQEAVDNFVMNTHVLAKLRRALKEKMDLKTSCVHKEFAHGQMKLHENYIQNLLASLHTDPFHGTARSIISGLEISNKLVDNLLSAKDVGEKTFRRIFIRDRVTSRNISFF